MKGSRVARQEKSRVASSERSYIFISSRILPFLITTYLSLDNKEQLEEETTESLYQIQIMNCEYTL